MTRMLDLIEDYLFLSSHPFERLDGSVAGERRQQASDLLDMELRRLRAHE